MQGTTHMAVGCTAALLILQPKTIPELVFGLGVSSVGAIICDVDSGSSISRRKAEHLFAYTAFITVLLLALDLIFRLYLIRIIFTFSGIAKRLAAFFGAAAICYFGKKQEHRTFMHSLPVMAALTGCVACMIPDMTGYFAAAFVSHIVLDLMNYQGIQLLFPFRHKFCLNLCKSGGRFDRLLLKISSAALIIAIAWLALRILF